MHPNSPTLVVEVDDDDDGDFWTQVNGCPPKLPLDTWPIEYLNGILIRGFVLYRYYYAAIFAECFLYSCFA